MSFAGQRQSSAGVVARIVIGLLSLLAFGIGALSLNSLRGHAEGADQFAQMMVSPGFGMFLILVSSAVLFLLAILPGALVAGALRATSAASEVRS